MTTSDRPAARGRGSRVLVVDDSPTCRAQFRQTLEVDGYEVVEATNGKTGLEIFRSSRFDVVLSDVVMPGMSGYELCRAIKAETAREPVPVLLITTLSGPSDIFEGLASGADNFVTKPIEDDYLLDRIASVLNRAFVAHSDSEEGVRVDFQGRTFHINSRRSQILALLLTSFTEISGKTRQLELTNHELAVAKATLETYAQRLEEKARVSEERYFQLMQHASDCIFLVDEAGHVIEANRSAGRLLGCTPSEIIGRHCGTFLVSADGQPLAIDEIWVSGSMSRSDVAVQRADHDRVAFDFSATLVHLGDRSVVLLIGRDVTERQRAEQRRKAEEAARRASEELVRRLLESTGEAIFGMDPDGRCTFCNPACAKALGVEKPEDLHGKRLHERICGASACDPIPWEECHINRATHEGKNTQRDDLTFQRTDGTNFPAECRSYPMREDDRIVGTVVTFNDITQRKALQAQLLQAQKMEVVGQLTGGVAHDFNNILTVIMGYTRILLEETMIADLKEPLEQVLGASKRAAALTRQLLAFSRIHMTELTNVDMNGVISDMEKMLRRLIGAQIDLKIFYGRDVATIRADPAYIEQIVMNLVVNARDAMPDGGVLTVETAAVTLSEEDCDDLSGARPGRYVLLTVGDTGIGMDAATQAHIFEPFFTTKEKGKGTGLGLATVSGIVKQCQGRISVYSEPGKGTTFEIFLPAAEEKTRELDQVQEKAPSTRGHESILVVDDDLPVRTLVSRILRHHGYEVLEAAGPGAALALLLDPATRVDLLLTDVIMPGLTGVELVKEATAARPSLRVAFMSGHPGTKGACTLTPGDADLFLQKPFSAETLVQKLRAALDGRPPG